MQSKRTRTQSKNLNRNKKEIRTFQTINSSAFKDYYNRVTKQSLMLSTHSGTETDEGAIKFYQADKTTFTKNTESYQTVGSPRLPSQKHSQKHSEQFLPRQQTSELFLEPKTKIINPVNFDVTNQLLKNRAKYNRDFKNHARQSHGLTQVRLMDFKSNAMANITSAPEQNNISHTKESFGILKTNNSPTRKSTAGSPLRVSILKGLSINTRESQLSPRNSQPPSPGIKSTQIKPFQVKEAEKSIVIEHESLMEKSVGQTMQDYRAFPYCYFTNLEKQKAKIKTFGEWVPRSIKNADRTATALEPPVGVGMFSRTINNMKVSVVKPLVDKNSTITKLGFIQNEGWIRRKQEYAPKHAKEFAQEWLSKGIDGKKAKPVNEDKFVMDGEEEDDSNVPDYLKKDKIIIFDPDVQVKKWRDTGEQVESYSMKLGPAAYRLFKKLMREHTDLLSQWKKESRLYGNSPPPEDTVKAENTVKPAEGGSLGMIKRGINPVGSEPSIFDRGDMDALIEDYVSDQENLNKHQEQMKDGTFYDQNFRHLFEEFLEYLQQKKIRPKVTVDIETQHHIIKKNFGIKKAKQNIIEHDKPRNQMLRKLINFKHEKKAELVSLNIPKNYKYMVQHLEKTGKILTSKIMGDQLLKLIAIFDQEDRQNRERILLLFQFSLKKKIAQTLFTELEIDQMHDPWKDLKLKPYYFSTGPTNRPYLKIAMDRINRDLKLPKDFNQDEVLTDAIKSDCTDTFQSDSDLEDEEMMDEATKEDKVFNKLIDLRTSAQKKQFKEEQRLNKIKMKEKQQEMALKNDKNEIIFEKESKKHAFYSLIKDISNKQDHIAMSANGGCPPVLFYNECQKTNIVPLPLFAKVDSVNKRFILTDYFISRDMAISLQKYFQNSYENRTDIIKECHLERNGANDESLAILLEGIATGFNRRGGQKLDKLSLINNEIGPKTLEVIQDSYLDHLKFLCLSDVFVSNQTLREFFAGLRGYAFSLQHINFKGLNLRTSDCLPHFLEFLEWEVAVQHLQTLNVCNCSLSSQQMRSLVKVLHEKHLNNLTDLNVSYNLLETDHAKRKPNCSLSATSIELLEELSQFVQESPSLTHLDISGMQVGSMAQELVKKFQNSDSLRVVHMNNNMISYESKKFISNMILTDYGNLKKEQKAYVNLNKIGTGVRECDQSQVKLVNHQLIQKVQQNIFKTNAETQDKFPKDGTNDQFSIVRKLDADIQNKEKPQTDLEQQIDKQWRVSLKQDCWVCQKWNFALIFFNVQRPMDHCELIFHQETTTQLNQQIFVKRSVTGAKEKITGPQLAGSMTGWQPEEMAPLSKFCERIHSVNKKFRFNKDYGVSGNSKSKGKKETLMRQKCKVMDNIDKQYAEKVIAKIRKHVPCAQQANILNWPSDTTLEDVEQDHLWCWMGFIKPGTHSIIFRDLKERIFSQTLILNTRPDDTNLKNVYNHNKLQVVQEKTDSSETHSEIELKQWQAPSVFENWHVDTYDTMLKAFKTDSKFYMIKRNLKGLGTAQVRKVLSTIQENYSDIKNVFIDMAARSTEYPGIDYLTITQMFEKWNIDCFDLSKIAKIFQIANDQDSEDKISLKIDNFKEVEGVEEEDDGALIHAHQHNTAEQLRRFEFTDLLILAGEVIARDLLGYSEQAAQLPVDVATQLEKLIKGKLVKKHKPRMEWQKFRDQQLWTTEVNLFFSERIEWLANLFQNFAEKQDQKLVFSLYSMQTIVTKVQQFTISGQDRREFRFAIAFENIQYCFALSKMTIIDDNMQESHYFKLKFVEMFECLARLACFGKLEECDKTSDENETQKNLIGLHEIQEGQGNICLLSLVTLFELLEQVVDKCKEENKYL